MEQYIKQLHDFMVMIRCFTYNHSNYITDALNGFTMQITNFPFVIVLVDDASTDGEQNVINNYVNENFKNYIFSCEIDDANISLSQHKTNQKCFMVVYYLKQNHYSIGKGKVSYTQPWRNKCKYEAICEGDDYWIDPLKLQKQVDFLEANPEYGIVRTNVHRCIQKENRLEYDFFSHGKWGKIKDTFHDYIIHGWFAAPCTWLYCTEYTKKYLTLQQILKNKDCFTGDIALLLCIIQDSKIKYFSESTTIYRVLEKSASHLNNFDAQYLFFLRVLNTKTYFAQQTHFFIRLKNWIFNTRLRLYYVLRFCQLNYLPLCIKSTFQDFYKLFIHNAETSI